MSRVSTSASRRPYVDWTDKELTQALRNDQEAFREIYERYWYGLFRLACRKLGRREEAEELVQDLFASIWLKRDTLQIGQIEGYLKTAVKYRVIDAIRAGQTQLRYMTVTKGSLSDIDLSTEEHVAAEDLSQALVATVRRLPEHTREVYTMSRTEHQSVSEIAERLQVSPKTVEYHLTKALKFLRLGLKDFLVLAMVWLAQD